MACSAKSTTVTGHSQSTAVTERPVTASLVARWMTSAGTSRKPARPVRKTNGRGSVRTCAYRPVSTTSQMTTTPLKISRTSGRNGNISAPLVRLARHVGWRQAPHEDVERLLRFRLRRREGIEQQQPALRHRVRAQVAGVHKEKPRPPAVRGDTHDRRAVRAQAPGARRSDEQAAEERRIT